MGSSRANHALKAKIQTKPKPKSKPSVGRKEKRADGQIGEAKGDELTRVSCFRVLFSAGFLLSKS